MPRIVLALVLCCAAVHGAAAAAGTAKAANEGLASCLDPSTTLLAGGDVGDNELMAAQNACARLKQSSSDRHTIARIDAAAAGTAKAANEGLASCLDPSTTLLAGGDVGDKELMAAQNACARLKQSSSDSHTIARINAAAANIAAELRRRQTSKQP